MRVLCICHEPRQPEYNRLFENNGITALTTSEVEEGLDHLKMEGPDVVVAHFPLPDWTPADLLTACQRLAPEAPVIFRIPKTDVMETVRLVKLGLFQMVPCEAGDAEFLHEIETAAEEARLRTLAVNGPGEGSGWERYLIGDSWAMREVSHVIRLVASKRCTVLISGETGTGKEMAARALHAASPRASVPIVAVNCGAIPEHLLEDELFGHVKGAFTGAMNSRIGRVEQANKGTLFLDEIGEMPLDLQAKLLRVLQEREFQRLGSSETVQTDARFVAASNANLLERVKQGKFREDLFYRLSVVPIHMPPLRERVTDIPLLAHHFVAKVCRREDTPVKRIHWETVERLQEHSWPGNVRQLENAIEMAVALSGPRPTLYPSDFPLLLQDFNGGRRSFLVPDTGLDFERVVSQYERDILAQALRNARGNKKLAAEMLRLKRTTLTAKLRTLNVTFEPEAELAADMTTRQ